MRSLRDLLRPRHPTVSVVRLQGAIGAAGRGLSDVGLAPVIEAAFRNKPAAVALEINSPGGSPVQSALIAARIRRLADDKNVPVLAFVEDVAASGGYWLACAADEIHADRGSLLGSIGVISAGFGFHQAIARYGVERFGAPGDAFDPQVHEAVMSAPEDPSATVPTCVQVFSPGYRLASGRVLRAAKVVVAEPGAAAPLTAPDAQPDGLLARAEDRIAALGGTLTVTSTREGLVVEGEVP